jgi:hypothetical protein
MQNTLRDITGARFRANPHYELLTLERLSPEERQVLDGLQRDPDFYGVLRPRAGGDGLNFKSVCRETALQIYSLQTPGLLPSSLGSQFGGQLNQAIAELVLDGILEIDAGDGFVSGAAAHAFIHGESPEPEEQSWLSHLSHEALRHAQALELTDPRLLAQALYGYNRVPVTPRWKRRLGTTRSVFGFLGLERGSASRHLLEEVWQQAEAPDSWPVWFHWRPRATVPRTVLRSGQVTYKIYISPRPESLPEVLRQTLETLAETGPCLLKFGSQLSGILRPDKLVLYFPDLQTLEQAGGALAERLSGQPPQGVPFTAEIAGDGLLSWGIDPPHDSGTVSWRRVESWRGWLANELAVALLLARSEPDGPEPWRFALDRIRLKGIDTSTWMASQLHWRDLSSHTLEPFDANH